MARITKIEAAPVAIKKTRVAAYARVSTDSEEQLLSLETQKVHYEDYIKANPELEYAGLYYDEGISGTKVDKRDGLLKLLKDCEDGKIDRVITKSISRFSRNTTDCLEMVRNLSKFGVYLYFEKENIDTEHMSSELMLSILSSIAESESRSISENSKWAVKHRFEEGTFIISFPPYGYANVNGKMVIVPEEAKVVKQIFKMTISGQGSYVIAKALNAQGIQSKLGNKWHSSTVKGILKNEKYTGDVIFQKTYTDESFNRHTNYGEKNMYLCKDHHDAIISHEIFEKAAEVMAQRGKEKSIDPESNKYLNRYSFSGRIICGDCGSTFKRRYHYKPSGDYVAWTCKKHLEDKKVCGMLYIKDADIKAAFLRMMRKLQSSESKIVRPFAEGLRNTNNKARLQEVLELEKQIEKNTEQQNVLINLMSSGYIEPAIYHTEKNELLAESERLKREKLLVSKNIHGDLTHLEEAQKLVRVLSRKIDITEFDDDLFMEHVDTITVLSREEIAFNLKCGLRIRERLVEI